MFPRPSAAIERTFHESASASDVGTSRADTAHPGAGVSAADAALFERLAYAANVSGARLDRALDALRQFSAWLAAGGHPNVTALIHEPEIASRLIERFNPNGTAGAPCTPARPPLPLETEHDLLAIALPALGRFAQVGVLEPAIAERLDDVHFATVATPRTRTRSPAARRRGIAASLRGLLTRQQTPDERVQVRAWSAARSSDHEKLRTLLAEHPDLLFRTDRNGQNLLSVAAREGRHAAVVTLLSHAAIQPGGVARIVNQRNAQGETPLFAASARAHAAVVSALLGARECDVNAEDRQFRTPLHKAVKEGHAEIVGLLLADDRIAAGLPDVNDDTPLHLAVLSRPELVKVLAAHPSAVPNAPDKKGRTALERAIDYGKHSVVADLLTVERVDASRPGNDGLTPFWRALRQFKRDIEGSLGATKSSRKMLETLANCTRVDMSSRAPYPGNEADDIGGHTPLTLLGSLRYYRPSVEEQNRRFKQDVAGVVQAMLTRSRDSGDGRNLDPNAKDDHGRTPLQWAFSNGHDAIVALLLNDPRTDPNVRNAQGQTLLEMAAVHDRTDWAHALLSNARTNPNLPTSNGRPLLAWAMQPNRQDWADLLLNDPRTDPNVRNARGQTLLEMAAIHDRTDWARALLSNARTNPNLPMSNGRPLLAWAMQHNRHDWARLLLRDRRTDPNVSDIMPGRTLLLSAAEHGRLDFARLLYQDARTDPNALATLLTLHPQTVHAIVEHNRPLPRGSAGDRALQTFKEEALKRWADTRRADGTRWPKAAITNMRLGEMIAEREHLMGASSSACRPDAAYRFALALELSIQHNELIQAKEAAGLLLRHAPPDRQSFNLHGVDVSRTEVESWAAGQFSEGLINRAIEAQMHEPQHQSVHFDGLNARGAYILSVAQAVIRESAGLSPEALHDATQDVLAERVRSASGAAAMPSAQPRIDEQALLGLDETLAAIKEAAARAGTLGVRAAEGMNWALRVGRARELLDLSPQQALRIMWTYIDRRGDRHRENLTQALLSALADIAQPNGEGVCAQGCVQRILCSADGIDDLLTPKQPDQATIRGEILTLAGKVNERFETLYGDSALDLADKDSLQSTPGAPLTDEERSLIGHYQRHAPVDDAVVLRIKQDMLAAEVTADLVARRGWSPQAVEPELARVTEEMRHL